MGTVWGETGTRGAGVDYVSLHVEKKWMQIKSYPKCSIATNNMIVDKAFDDNDKHNATVFSSVLVV